MSVIVLFATLLTDLPVSLQDPAPDEAWRQPKTFPSNPPLVDGGGGVWIGRMRARGADDAAWMAAARISSNNYFIRTGFSMDIHESEFAGGDAKVLMIPYQYSMGTRVPLHFGPIRISTHLTLGGGWVYSHYAYAGSLSGFRDESDGGWCWNWNAGIEVYLEKSATIGIEYRQVAVNLDPEGLPNRDLDHAQFTIGYRIFY